MKLKSVKLDAGKQLRSFYVGGTPHNVPEELWQSWQHTRTHLAQVIIMGPGGQPYHMMNNQMWVDWKGDAWQ